METTTLLTGASGFLGKWLLPSLRGVSKVSTVGRKPDSDVYFDFTNNTPFLSPFEWVVHAAGKAHSIPHTKTDKDAFFAVNTKGTKYLLEALESSPVKKLVFLSSVSVYGLEEGLEISEDYPLEGKSPYGQSKIQAEKLIMDWSKKRNISWLILRLPLVVGKNPPGNLGTFIRAFKAGFFMSIDGGQARKSMVLGEDVAHLIVTWLQNPHSISGIYHITDGLHPSFQELENLFSKIYGNRWVWRFPEWLARFLSVIGERIPFFPFNRSIYIKMTRHLTFSDSKAREQLHWKPNSVLDKWAIQ